MNKDISKKEFCKAMDVAPRAERMKVANELCVASESRLKSRKIPGAILNEITHVRSRILMKKKASTWNLWKLWVFVIKPEDDLKNWRMTAKQCYRLDPNKPAYMKYTQHDLMKARPRTNQKRERRPTIRDCNGDAVPRRWLDRFAPHIKTQADWDAGSIYKGGYNV